MKVYLVRHGESKLNAKRIHQNAKSELSELGVKQAEFVAKRFIRIPVDVIVASPFTRAKQTAEIINSVLKKPIKFTSLLAEQKRPTVIEGLHYDDPAVIEIHKLIKVNWHNPAWRHSDEETFFDLKERAEKVIENVLELKKENVLLVTHGDIMGMIFLILAQKDKLEPNDYWRFRTFLAINNTGITLYEYKNEKWKDVQFLAGFVVQIISSGSETVLNEMYTTIH